MRYAVQKDPIKVIEIKGSDNINNYSELTYRKLETVPVGVPDKYLKWELDVLVEMTTVEKAIVDGSNLAELKAKKIIKIRIESDIAVKSVFTGTGVTLERAFAYMWSEFKQLVGVNKMNSDLELAFGQALIANSTIEETKLAAVEAATTVEELEAI